MILKSHQIVYLESLVDVYPDYPKEGVSFKDLSQLYTDVYAINMITDSFAKQLSNDMPDCIIGCDARGFILGTLLAQRLQLPLVLARKPGKLPGEIISKKYKLEYGEAELQMHKHIISQYKNPLIADDVLATGGTVIAVANMLRDIHIMVHSFAFISEVRVCDGRNKILQEFNHLVGGNKILSALKS